MTWFLTWLLAPIIRAEIDRIVAHYGPDLLKRAAESRRARAYKEGPPLF